ncbi:hypothetical protein HY212_04565 [Candidatus Pacearchaeota archaeon]|nr:hypothetical protein [Candidatus Pacearchaeota archaeon]
MGEESLEDRIKKVVASKLKEHSLEYDSINVIVMYDIWTVGVQGDERTYRHPVEIGVIKNEQVIWNAGFIREMSTEITNKIKEINKVVYTIQ